MMVAMHAGLLWLLFCSACCFQFRKKAEYGLSVRDPDSEWKRMEASIAHNRRAGLSPRAWKEAYATTTTAPAVTSFPQFVRVPYGKYQKEAFKPEKGTRPLPVWAKDILLVPTATELENYKPAELLPSSKQATTQPVLVEVLCHVDRMYVRVRKELFNDRDAYKDLKLGSCVVNRGTSVHYYFLNLLTANCGFVSESKPDYLLVKIRLTYTPSGPIIRELPFDIPVECRYQREFHSYKVGFKPKIQGGTVFKALQPKQSAVLTPQDASGKELTGTQTYTLGQPMYFEAKQEMATSKNADQRLYIKKCFMTANSNLKYTVIDNQGCMIDSRTALQSMFLSGPSKLVQKLTLSAFIIAETASAASSQQLKLQCEVSVGALTPTSSSKACTFDKTTKKWKELYGDDSVCTCCDATCPSAMPKASKKTISSPSWRVDLSSKDGYEVVDLKLRSFDSDTLEDPNTPEHSDFLNYWDHDY